MSRRSLPLFQLLLLLLLVTTATIAVAKRVVQRGGVWEGGRGLGLASSSWRCEALSKFIQFKRRFLFPVSSFYVFSLPVVLHLSPGTCCCCCCMLHVASAKWVREREREMEEGEKEGGRKGGEGSVREQTAPAHAFN